MKFSPDGQTLSFSDGCEISVGNFLVLQMHDDLAQKYEGIIVKFADAVSKPRQGSKHVKARQFTGFEVDAEGESVGLRVRYFYEGDTTWSDGEIHNIHALQALVLDVFSENDLIAMGASRKIDDLRLAG